VINLTTQTVYSKDNSTTQVNPVIESLPQAPLAIKDTPVTSTGEALWSSVQSSIYGQAIYKGSDFVVDKFNQVVNNIPAPSETKDFDKWEVFNDSGLPDDVAEKYNNNSSTQFEATKFVSDYNRTQELNQKSYAAGLPSDIASFIIDAGLDPTTYVSFGAGAGMSLGKAAVTSGLAAGASVATRNVVDPTVTDSRMILEAAGGTMLGAVLGGAVGSYTRLKSKGLIKTPDLGAYVKAARSQDFTGSSVGAMAVGEKSAPKIARGARTASKAFSWVSPALKAQTFENDIVRTYAMNTTGAVVRTEGKLGVTVKDIYYDDIKTTQRLSNDTYQARQAWRKEQIANGTKNPTNEQFDLEHWLDSFGLSPAQNKHVITSVAKNEQLYKKFDARNTELASDIYQTKAGYKAPLVIDRLAAKQNFDELVEVFRGQIRKTKQGVANMSEDELNRLYRAGLVDEALGDFEKQLQTIREYREYDIDAAALKMASEMADGLTDKVFGMEKSNPFPRFFNPRNINPADFVKFAQKNPEKLAAIYTTNVSPQLGLAQVFGTTDASKIITELKDKVELQNEELRGKMLAGADKKVIEKQIEKNSKEYTEASKLIADTVSMINKTKYGDFYKQNPVMGEALAMYDQYVTLRDQQGTGIMQIAELGAVAFHHGFMKTIGKNYKVMGKYIASSEVRNAVRQSSNQSGRALEAVANKNITDILLHSDTAAESGLSFAKGREVVGSMFSKVTGYQHIIGFTRDVISATHDMNFLENLTKMTDGTLPQTHVDDMAFLGIDAENLPRVMAQIEKHKTDFDGIPLLNIDNWDDAGAAQITRIALQRDMRRTVNEAATGDMNYTLAHPMLKPLVKLRSWTIGASQNYLLNGMTRLDADRMAAIGYMMLVGGLVVEGKNYVLGRPPTEDVETFVWNGASSTGIAGIYNILFLDELAQTAGVPMQYDANSIFTNPAAVIAGVNKRTYDHLSSIDDAIDGDKRAIDRLKKALPLNSYPFIRQTLDIDYEK
jgi:hypothetical protein